MLLRRLLLGTAAVIGEDDGSSGSAQEDEFVFALYVCVSLVLVLIAGLMSGLTLGLMSLDMVELEVLKRSGTAEEKACAIKIMPVIKNQHMLLVTLLLCNAAATEALPIFIDRLADPLTAILVSVTVVLVFGEIIPQSICSRYGLKVGAYSAWFVKILMVLCSPISWPIAKLLDFLLGADHSALFRRGQLKALVDLHGTQAGFGGTLSEDEVHVIRGALDLTSKVASKSMTPLDKVFMLATDDRLDERTLQAILMSGHSRIPVHREGSRKEILGLVLVKELVLVNPADHMRVGELKLRELPRLAADTPMYDMLKLFETGKSHMAILTKPIEEGGSAGSVVGRRRTGGASWQTNPRFSSFKRPGSSRPGSSYRPSGSRAAPFEVYSTGEDFAASQEPEPVGIITIEDVIEELLQEEIIDETDLYIDNLQSQRVNVASITGSLPPRLKQVLSAGLFTPRVGRLGGMPPSPRGGGGGGGSAFGQLQHQQELVATGGGAGGQPLVVAMAAVAGGGGGGGEREDGLPSVASGGGGGGTVSLPPTTSYEMRWVAPAPASAARAGSGSKAGATAALDGDTVKQPLLSQGHFASDDPGP